MQHVFEYLRHVIVVLLLLATNTLQAYCDSPSPAFPIPQLEHPRHASSLATAAERITSALGSLAANPEYNTTHVSIEVTSQQCTLLSLHRTAPARSSLFHGGAKVIDNTTMYRIASMTKPFTVLALFQLEKAGKLSLDDSVLTYLPELNTTGVGKGRGGLPWKDITIRAMASQIGGLPRDFAQGDLINDPDLAKVFGLPEIDEHDEERRRLPQCDEMLNYTRACNASDLLGWVDGLLPLYAPNQKSTYSNIGFDLLGLVIANVSGLSYEEYIETKILREIGMEKSSFSTPPDDVAAIAKGVEYYWPFEIGVQNPTGGMYSSSSELSTWLRYVMRTYNAQTSALNWFNPTSFSGSLNTYYGMPWEIFRAKTLEVLPGKSTSTRPLTFITKGGGLPAYSSHVIMIPEYGLGITILVAGNGKVKQEMWDVVAREVVSFAEEAAFEELTSRYVGIYKDEKTNSSLSIGKSDMDGLFVQAWTSRGVDVKHGLTKLFTEDGGVLVLHLVPTLLFINEENQQGERWRVDWQKKRSDTSGPKSIWDNYCSTDIESFTYYAGKPVNEIVFWGGKQGEEATSLDLTGFRSTLKRDAIDKHEHNPAQDVLGE